MEEVKELNLKNQTYHFFNDILRVNLLYLIIHSGRGHFEEKNCQKYLIIDSTAKYEEVFFWN